MASPDDEIKQAKDDSQAARDAAHDAINQATPDVPTAVGKFNEGADVWRGKRG